MNYQAEYVAPAEEMEAWKQLVLAQMTNFY